MLLVSKLIRVYFKNEYYGVHELCSKLSRCFLYSFQNYVKRGDQVISIYLGKFNLVERLSSLPSLSNLCRRNGSIHEVGGEEMTNYDCSS